MKHTISALALALACSAPHAEFYTGNDLLSLIRDGSPVKTTQALGYIAGVHDVGFGANHCTPSSVTAGQLLDLVRQTLEGVPQHRDKSADSLVLITLKAAWPCKQAPARGGSVL
jgi:hypothetical protein